MANPRFRITLIATIDYESNPAAYPGCTTDEDRLAIDIANYRDDPQMLLLDDKADIKVKGEVVE